MAQFVHLGINASLLNENEQLKDENAKLRAAVKKTYNHIKETCDMCDGEYCLNYDEKNECCVFDLLLKELGIKF